MHLHYTVKHLIKCSRCVRTCCKTNSESCSSAMTTDAASESVNCGRPLKTGCASAELTSRQAQ